MSGDHNDGHQISIKTEVETEIHRDVSEDFEMNRFKVCISDIDVK